MPVLPWLLPTETLYQSPSFGDSNEKKETWIHTHLASNYITMTDEDKWDHLMGEFSNRALVADADKTLFAQFRDNRKETTENRHNISLKQCLAYFENFIFLYCNTESGYELTLNNKQAILNDIKRGMQPGICEPGKITHFEATLQKYRKDTNWILQELYEHRLNIVQRIADEYNNQNHIHDGMSIHTVMHMQKLAKDSQLGIDPSNEINDSYLYVMNTTPMSDYFKRVSVDKFAEYERNIAANLNNHLMTTVLKWFQDKRINITTWEQNGLLLNQNDTPIFNEFITGLLDISIDSLGEWDEDYVNFKIHSKQTFQNAMGALLNKKLIRDGYFVKFQPYNPRLLILPAIPSPQNPLDLAEPSYVITDTGFYYFNTSLKALDKLVDIEKDMTGNARPGEEEKLIQLKERLSQHSPEKRLSDENLKTITDITGHLSPEKLTQHDIHLPKSITLDELVSFSISLEVMETKPNPLIYAQEIISKNADLIKRYPFLLVNLLIQHPNFWCYLPKVNKNDIQLIDACLIELTQLLLKTTETREIDQLLHCLFTITKSNPDYLNGLSPELMAKKSVVERLVAKNGLLLGQASAALKADLDITEVAIEQNPMASLFKSENKADLATNHWHLLNTLPLALQSNFNQQNLTEEMIHINIEKMKSIHRLLTTPHMSTGQVIKLTQSITPAQLIVIMDSRASMQPPLPELPHCNKTALNLFNNNVNNDLWRTGGYLELKRQMAASGETLTSGAYLTPKFHQYHVHQAITQSNQWFLAFMSYQKELPMIHARFQSLWDVLWQLKLSGRSLFALMNAINAVLSKILTFLSYVIIVSLIEYALGFIINPVLYGLFYLAANFGLFPILAIEMALTIAIAWPWIKAGLSTWAGFQRLIAATLLLLYLAAVDPLEMAIELSLFIAGAALYKIIPLIIKFVSIITFHELSWSEINDILRAAVSFYLQNYQLLNITFINAIVEIINLVIQTPTLLFDALAPWITRTWATLTASKGSPPTATEALTMDVENSIYRLVSSTEPSAQQKGELLETLWEKVKLDVDEGKVTYAQGLNKAYGVNSANDDVPQRTLSFWGVASTRRDSSAEFKAQPTPANSSFSFFGKPTTAEKLKAHVDFTPLPEAACG